MQINNFPGDGRPGQATPTARKFFPQLNRDQLHRKTKAYQAVVNSAHEKFRPKAYVEEHHALFVLASGLRWPLHVFSIVLAGLFALAIIAQAITGDSLAEIWTAQEDRMEDLYLPLALVVLALLLLEWGKSVVTDQAVTAMLKRKYGIGLAVILVALALSGASFYSSVNGGSVWGEVSTTPEASELQNLEQIRDYWTAQMEQTQGNIDRIENRLKKQDSWQDRKPGGTLDKLHKEKEKLGQRMEAEMAAARAENTQTKTKAAIDGFYAGNVLFYTSAAVEVLILLCLFYLVYHRYRVESENESGVSAYTPEAPRGSIGFQPFQASPAMEDPDSGKIGFKMAGSSPAAVVDLAGIAARLRDLEARLDRYRPADPPAAPPGRTVTVHDHTEGFPIVCEHCGKEAIMKSPNAKYCSSRCKKDAYNERNPDNQVRFTEP